MARTAFTDLTSYEAWLVDRGKSPLVARAYASHVRRMKAFLAHRSADESLTDSFNRYFTGKRSDTQYRVAWNQYVIWCELEGVSGISKAVKSLTPKHGISLWPKDVKKAIRAIARAFKTKPETLVNLTWATVDWRLYEGKYVLTNQEGARALVEVKAIKALHAWAQPTSPNDPLIPAGPGVSTHISPQALKRFILS